MIGRRGQDEVESGWANARGTRGADVKERIMSMEINVPGQATVKMTWICATCSTPVQSYFDHTEHLRCAVCCPGTATHMDVSPRRWGGDPDGLPIRIMFEKIRGTDFKAHELRWRPVPCIDPTVDTRMAALLRAEGLEGCFVNPAHLHGHFVLAEGETLAERCPTGGCTWERSAPNGFFATNRVPEPPPAHFAGLNCWAAGYKECGIAPPSARFSLTNCSFVGPVVASRDVNRTPVEEFAKMGARIAAEAGYRTKSDRDGSWYRDDVPDSVAGFLLGCACPEHKSPKPEPWVPSVDEFDLLPDA
jgi:hypothetical protein